MENQGLYQKYIVTKVETGEPVEGCFVLRPDRDWAARKALDFYAWTIKSINPELYSQIKAWLIALEIPEIE